MGLCYWGCPVRLAAMHSLTNTSRIAIRAVNGVVPFVLGSAASFRSSCDFLGCFKSRSGEEICVFVPAGMQRSVYLPLMDYRKGSTMSILPRPLFGILWVLRLHRAHAQLLSGLGTGYRPYGAKPRRNSPRCDHNAPWKACENYRFPVEPARRIIANPRTSEHSASKQAS
jgi:hypothetical protein